MNNFEKMKLALEAKGWHVGWAQGFFQDEGWCDCPYEADLDKCLFNIIQDVQDEDGITLLEDELKEKFAITEDYEYDNDEYEEACEELWEEAQDKVLTPDQVDGSPFCFGNVETLNEIIPIIIECGCSVDWDGSIKTRPYITWNHYG